MPQHYATSQQSRIILLENYIGEQLDKKITVKDMQFFCGIGKQKFYSLFIEAFGQTPQDYLRSRKMEKAYAGLVNTFKPVKLIARESGYKNTKSFLRAYKKHFGKTPGETRREISF